MEKYRNQELPISERVADLLSRMTLKEKMGQLNQRMFGWHAWERVGPSGRGDTTVPEDRVAPKDAAAPEFAVASADTAAPGGGYGPSAAFRQEVEDGDGLGALYGLFRADPWSGTTYDNGVPVLENARVANALQRYVLENTRLGIPILFSEECPHGHQALDGTMMPVNLAVGATWNPALYRKAFACVAEEIRSRGAHLGLVSALDILRDPRWGRSEECYGEDPYLAARMTEAVVKGLQGETPDEVRREDRVAAVVKHFCAQGAATGGRNAGPANIGERELREIHLPGMQAAIQAGALGCMAAYNEIDGVYCHANRRLLNGILREEFGFDGVVMSDGGAIDVLDKVTGDPAASAAMALSAGVDLNLWCKDWLLIPEAVERGLVPESVVDQAVVRVLTLKYMMGLFEHPYADESLAPAVFSSGRGQAANLNLAREVPVLLENREAAFRDGCRKVLPFQASMKRIAVIGPNSDNLYNQLGDYTAPQRSGSGTTVLQAMKALAPSGTEIVHAQGCGIRHPSREGISTAVRLAESADAVVLVLGGSSARDFGQEFLDNGAANVSSGVLTDMDCGEGVDVADLELGGVQLELAKAVLSTGKPVVTVVIAGRPPALPWLSENSHALLFCGYPGMEGGTAIAEILYGLVNPSGRLSVSLPRSSAALPAYYNRKIQYTENWLDQPGAALYPFGFGLGYAGFSLSRLCGPEQVRSGESCTMTVELANEGACGGAEVVQLYLTDLQSSVNRRVLELKAFDKVELEAGASRTVRLELPPESFAVWDAEMRFRIEPGDVRITACIGNGCTLVHALKLVAADS